jgi:hypothetical protein
MHRKKAEKRGKKEEGRGKKEEGRRKKEQGRRKKEEKNSQLIGRIMFGVDFCFRLMS